MPFTNYFSKFALFIHLRAPNIIQCHLLTIFQNSHYSYILEHLTSSNAICTYISMFLRDLSILRGKKLLPWFNPQPSYIWLNYVLMYVSVGITFILWNLICLSIPAFSCGKYKAEQEQYIELRNSSNELILTEWVVRLPKTSEELAPWPLCSINTCEANLIRVLVLKFVARNTMWTVP